MKNETSINIIERSKDLLEKIAVIQKDSERQRMITGSGFSMFSPGLLNLDEMTASRILAHLLDPAGSHGQGVFFLRKLLQLLEIPEPIPNDAFRVRVALEQVTYGAARPRRLDILLEGDSFVLGIENKLGAGTGKDQLTDYLDWLRQHSASRYYYLVYLTPHGEDAGEWGLTEEARAKHANNFFLLSWEKLLAVLQDCVSKIPARVGYFLEDFCRGIMTQKLGKSAMEENTNEVVNYLENLPTTDDLLAACALFHGYKTMVNNCIYDWLRRLKEALEPKLSKKITIADKFVDERWEITCLKIEWEDWRVTLKVSILPYSHPGVAAKTIFWGEMIWKWTFPNNDPTSDSWIKYLMQEYGKECLTRNFLQVNELYAPTDPIFLNLIRDRDKIYLYDELLASAQKIKDLRTAWENTRWPKTVDNEGT